MGSHLFGDGLSRLCLCGRRRFLVGAEKGKLSELARLSSARNIPTKKRKSRTMTKMASTIDRTSSSPRTNTVSNYPWNSPKTSQCPWLYLLNPHRVRALSESMPTLRRTSSYSGPAHHEMEFTSRHGRLAQLPSFSLLGALEFRHVITSLQHDSTVNALAAFDAPYSPYAGGITRYTDTLPTRLA